MPLYFNKGVLLRGSSGTLASANTCCCDGGGGDPPPPGPCGGPPGEVKCGTTCCFPYETCVNGECKASDCQCATCCSGCSPEPARSELIGTVCNSAFGSAQAGRSQNYSPPDASGFSWSWKPGYPARLGNCALVWVADGYQSLCQGVIPGVGFACGTKDYYRFRLFIIRCPGGVPQLVDVTNEAVTGELNGSRCNYAAALCALCEPQGSFYPDPEIICDP